MGNLRRKSYDRLRIPKEDQETLVTCPRCKGTGHIVLKDDGRIYLTKMCQWCIGSGGVNRDIFRAWQRLQRWIEHWKKNGLTPLF